MPHWLLVLCISLLLVHFGSAFNPRRNTRTNSAPKTSMTDETNGATRAKTSPYSSVVFSAYVVPTIPQLEGAIGDPDGAGYVTGTYVGMEDPKEDVAARLQLVEAAVNQVYEMAKDTRDDPSVLHVFLVPEFFFRGPTGAYDSGPDHELGKYAHQLLMDFIRKSGNKFDHWLLVMGSVLEADSANASPEKVQRAKVRGDFAAALRKAYDACTDDETRDFMFSLVTQTTDFAQKHPLYVVKNKCVIYKDKSDDFPDGLSVDKRFCSHEDFVMSYYEGAYSETAVSYPYVDEAGGEIKKEPHDPRCIFTMDGITFAVEICLDHRRKRIRTVLDSNKAADVPPIDVHLVPSCGMQIQTPSVVARKGGLVFNCDGQYANIDVKATPTDKESIFTGSADGKAHTQLCQVVEGPDFGGEANAKVAQPKNVKVTTAPLVLPKGVETSKLEAYGAGEVHLYTKCALPSR